MAQGWGDGGRQVVGSEDREPARLGDFTAPREYLLALHFRSLGERLAQEVCARRGGGHPFRGWHAGTDVKLMGCKSPDPNRPFGDLAGGRSLRCEPSAQVTLKEDAKQRAVTTVNSNQ